MKPKKIRASGEKLSIEWEDGHVSPYECRNLRLACRCANCVDEWTQQNLIHPERVPPVIQAKKIEVVGQYALHFDWTDGHSTGIYTYDYLRSLCSCETCNPRFSV